jgi:hypothetical protein
LKKLKSWDALPFEAEDEEIKMLITRVLQLKAETKKELNDTQLIVFLLQHRVQPLQDSVSKLWS